MELNQIEAIAIHGLQSQEREFANKLKLEYSVVTKLIEERLKLPAGSIGKTHIIDLSNNKVSEVEEKK